MAKRKTKGNRTKSGKLKRPSTTAERIKIDRGNPKVAERIKHFDGMVYQGGGHGKESCDAVGILFLTGNLDQFSYEPQTMVLALRKYQGCRSVFLAGMGSPKESASGNMQPTIRTTGQRDTNERAAELFETMDRAIGVASPRYQALQSLMFDGVFCVNDLKIPDWVNRYLLKFKLDKGMESHLHHWERPSEIDKARLANAGAALEAICEVLGAQRKKRAA